MNDNIPKRLTPKEAAKLIGITWQTLAVWRCTKRYNLPYVKIGNLISYKLEDVEKFIESHIVVPFSTYHKDFD